MINLDLNLLTLLDTLLTEKNITRAAKIKDISVSSMNRALQHMRNSLGDPLLVKSGREMVLTPYSTRIALELKSLIFQIENTFNKHKDVDLYNLEREFSLRATAGFADTYGANLMFSLRNEAPNVTLRLIDKEKKKADLLMQEIIDAEIAVLTDSIETNLKCKLLLRDRWIGISHINHPIAELEVSPDNIKSFEYVGVKRFSELGSSSNNKCSCNISKLINHPIIQVTGFSTAISIVEQYPVIGIVPERFTSITSKSIHKFNLPFNLPPLDLYLLWHPRYDSDIIHQWFRNKIYSLFNH